MHGRNEGRTTNLETEDPEDGKVGEIFISLYLHAPTGNGDCCLGDNDADQTHKDQGSSAEILNKVGTKESKNEVCSGQSQINTQNVEFLRDADGLKCRIQVETNDAAT